MNPMIRFPERGAGVLADGTKTLTRMVHSQGGGGSMVYPNFSMLPAGDFLPDTKINYEQEVGDGLRSSVLMAPLNFIMRTFPEAPPITEKRFKQQWDEEPDHPLTSLLNNPNDFYGGVELMMATALDLSFGNAYWIKIRNHLDEVVQLWWVPRTMMFPRWLGDPYTFIDHYDYFAGGTTSRIDPTDVVHFRFGLDPRNIRLGLSPLGALMRDVVMDDQAATFATAILKNLGVIGVVISPKENKGGTVQKGALQETKDYVSENFNGERRGKALALGAPTDVQLLQYNMQGFDVSPLRDVSEERVCAALGIPAAVVGFGTGLQQTKVGATMKEMRQLAWTGGLMPIQRIVSRTTDRSLLSDRIYTVDAGEYAPPTRRGTIRMKFDTSKVAALWENQADKHDRVRKDYLAGVITRYEARTETGRPAADIDKVYVQPVNVTQLNADGEPIPLAGSSTSANPPTPAGPEEDPNT